MSSSLAPELEQRILTRERFRLLALGYCIKGGVGVVFISFLLFHFSLFLGMSFIQASS